MNENRAVPMARYVSNLANEGRLGLQTFGTGIENN